MNPLDTLYAMLTYRRPAGSKSERRFINVYIRPLGMTTDKRGNLYKRIGDAPILWSCHTDTVHRHGGAQNVEVAGHIVALPKDSQSNCLGADDTVGVWLMREMILAQRPGLYVFHRAEECGGIGSDYIANETPELLDGIQAAIALDRRGTNSVITHQGMGRCCSDAFAESLCDALGNGYTPDSGGVFTDTANYVNLIGECSNVSVGYFGEHSQGEMLDSRHAMTLRDALLSFDHTTLVFERQPGEHDAFEGYDWSRDYFDHEREQAAMNGTTYDLTGKNGYRNNRSRGNLADLCRDYPNEVADILESYGMSYKEVADEIAERQGHYMSGRELSDTYA